MSCCVLGRPKKLSRWVLARDGSSVPYGRGTCPLACSLARRLSNLTFVIVQLRELDASASAKTGAPVASATSTDSMRASSPDGNVPPLGRSVRCGHKRACLAAGMLRIVTFRHFTKRLTRETIYGAFRTVVAIIGLLRGRSSSKRRPVFASHVAARMAARKSAHVSKLNARKTDGLYPATLRKQSLRM